MSDNGDDASAPLLPTLRTRRTYNSTHALSCSHVLCYFFPPLTAKPVPRKTDVGDDTISDMGAAADTEAYTSTTAGRSCCH